MTFFDKFELLKKSIPVPAVTIVDTVDCEYVDGVYLSKNCYFCFVCFDLEDGAYNTLGFYCKKLVDCDAVDASEKCYESINSSKCYNSTYLIDCNSCTDCHFSTFLISCTDCFGCVGLTHKKYCIFNKQFSKGEYFKSVEELKKEKPEKILAKMFKLKQTIPHPASQQFNNENCPYGDYIIGSKNMYWSFNSYYGENSGYTYVTGLIKNCWDILLGGGNRTKKTYSERCYELSYSNHCYNSAFLQDCFDCTNCSYNTYLRNCSDCFGCVGLTNKKYCIFNNQLTKEQYGKTVKVIKKELGWNY